MVGLIWAAFVFAASMVTFAWRGGDGDGAGGSGSDGGAMDFGPATAWATTGLTAFLTMTVIGSFLFFWRVSHIHCPRLIRNQCEALFVVAGMETL